MAFINNKEITDIYRDGKQLTSMYQNNVLLYTKGDVPPTPSGWQDPYTTGYLKMVSETPFTLSKTTGAATYDYSVDGETWLPWDGSSISSVNNTIGVRGYGNSSMSYNTDFAFVFSDATNVVITGYVDCLIDYNVIVAGGESTGMLNYQFYNCDCILQAPSFYPNATAVAYKYQYLYYECPNLQHIPLIHDIGEATNMYYGLFLMCSTLRISSSQTDETNYPIYMYIGGAEYSELMFLGTIGNIVTPEAGVTYYTQNPLV